MGEPKRVLIVDDSTTVLSFMESVCLEDGYDPVKAESGLQALVELKRDHRFHALVIDWMMPELTGIELLEQIKQKDEWKNIPVIMQTGNRDNASVLRGIQAGAYFYLTKPYKKIDLHLILKTAVHEYSSFLRMQDESYKGNSDILPFMKSGELTVRTFEEGQEVAAWLSRYSTRENICLGLEELIFNGIEHGNLGLTYEDKSHFLTEGSFDSEIKRRFSLEENRDKNVSIDFLQRDNWVEVRIRDRGKGFDYEKYLDFSPERIFDLHGRGVAIANKQVFDELSYHRGGSEVVVRFRCQ